MIYSVSFILYHLYIFNHGKVPAGFTRRQHRTLGLKDVIDAKVINMEDYCRYLLSPVGNYTLITTVVSKTTGEVYPLVLVLLAPFTHLVDFETIIGAKKSYFEAMFKCLPTAYQMTQTLRNKALDVDEDVPMLKTVTDLRQYFFKINGSLTARSLRAIFEDSGDESEANEEVVVVDDKSVKNRKRKRAEVHEDGENLDVNVEMDEFE